MAIAIAMAAIDPTEFSCNRCRRVLLTWQYPMLLLLFDGIDIDGMDETGDRHDDLPP